MKGQVGVDTHSVDRSTALVEAFLEAGLLSEETAGEAERLLEEDDPIEALAVVLDDRGL